MFLSECKGIVKMNVRYDKKLMLGFPKQEENMKRNLSKK